MVDHGKYYWQDGALRSWGEAPGISLLTHTLHYGLGAFEGIRAYRRASGQSVVFRLREHVERLYDSARLVLVTPAVSREQVMEGVRDVLRANDTAEAYLRPLVYLGEGAMGLMPRGNPPVTVVLAWTWGAYLGAEGLERGIRCKLSSFSRHAVGSALPRGKVVGQYVNSTLAKQEATLAGYDEAILLDSQGYPSEGSGENLFIVKGQRLYTPPLSSSILAGITRDTVLTLAEEAGLDVREESIPRDALYLADEVFLTGTAAEITPVREVDGRPIGDGVRGPVTARLQHRFFDIVRGTDDSHPEWLTLV